MLNKLTAMGFAVAVSSMGIATSATADMAPGDMYLSAAIGLGNSEFESNLDTSFDEPTDIFNSDSSSSPMLRFAVGRQFTQNLRGELELAYRTGEYGEYNIPAGPFTVDADGSVNSLSLMAAGYYVAPLSEGSASRVFFGAGLGFASLDMDLQRGANSPGFVVVQGDDLVVAGMLRGGFEHDVSEKSTIFADVTYFKTSTAEFSSFNSAFGVNPASLEYEAVEVGVGIRFNF